MWSAREIVMVGAGAVFGFAGAWLLIMRRPARRKRALHLAGSEEPGKLTEPTRLVLAMMCLLAGYHFMVWALTAPGTGIQLSRDLWYVWTLIGMAASIGSLLLDRMERGGESDGD